ncbi:MAG: translation initiation factor IF-3 [Gammaproteobacteria bacterium]|nr:translation initiation factor IF-3 [Gammaproteobacteria bacterium]
MTAKEKDVRINEEITAPQVRLVTDDAEPVVVSRQDALIAAEAAGLDLVEIAANAEPPVCRIMDYGKYQFEQNKKLHAARKKQKQVQLKEIKFRPGTEEGDYQVKLRSLTRFLEEGDRVKVTLRYRGREMAHQELGRDLLKRIEDDLSEFGTVDQFPRMEGRQMVMLIAPKRKK